MEFLKGFLLSLTAATATLSAIGYVRWMLTLSDAEHWLRNSFPVNFHLQHIAGLIGFPAFLWLLGGFIYFLPVFLAYLLAQHYRITNVFYYLAGAIICACFTASMFVGDPPSGEVQIPASQQFLSALILFLPACLVGALVFWRLAGRIIIATPDDD